MNKIWIFGQIINELGKTFFREYERGCLLTVVSAGGLFLFPEVGRNYFLVIPTGYSIMRIEKYGFMEMRKRLFIRITIDKYINTIRLVGIRNIKNIIQIC